MAIRPTERAVVLGELAQFERCRRSFPAFLRHVMVRSDDPLHPIITAWEPWPHLIERAEAWAANESEVILKGRQLGFTWLVAAYFDWRARNGWACAIISKGQDEARAVLARVKFIEDNLPLFLRIGATFRADEATYPGGGMIHAFPSTPDAGISYTFQLLDMDEAAFHPYGAANYAAIRPTLSAGGQILINSTADPGMAGSGFMPDIYWASKRGETGYRAVFVPWRERPGRDAAWLERERAAFTGRADEFSAYYAETDAEAFAGRSGLVYPMWRDELHAKVAVTAYEDCVLRGAGIDPGGGDPTGLVVMGRDRAGHFHQYAEMESLGHDSVTVERMADFLWPWHRRRPMQAVLIDTAGGDTLLNSLRAAGLPVYAAVKDRGQGLGLVAMLLEHNRFTIEPACRESIAEFAGYRWMERTDPNDRTRYATSTPVGHHADRMDARRYWLMWAAVDLWARRPLSQPHPVEAEPAEWEPFEVVRAVGPRAAVRRARERGFV